MNVARFLAADVLSPVFLIPQRRLEPDSLKESEALLQIAGAEFPFHAAFMYPGRFLTLERARDDPTGGPHPQQQIPGLHRPLLVVQDYVLLEHAPVQHAKPTRLDQGATFCRARQRDFHLNLFGRFQDFSISDPRCAARAQ